MDDPGEQRLDVVLDVVSGCNCEMEVSCGHLGFFSGQELTKCSRSYLQMNPQQEEW
jgi:hypothetical protein